MKQYLFVIVTMCALVVPAEAMAPPYLMQCGDNGLLNFKPDKDRNCWYYIYDASVALKAFDSVEVTEEVDVWFTKVLRKRKVESTWSIDSQVLLPPFFTEADALQSLQQEAAADPNASIPDFDPVTVREKLASMTEEAETARQNDMAMFTRLSGSAEKPTGEMLTITQQIIGNVELYQFIIDHQTQTVWKR